MTTPIQVLVMTLLLVVFAVAEFQLTQHQIDAPAFAILAACIQIKQLVPSLELQLSGSTRLDQVFSSVIVATRRQAPHLTS